MLGLKNVTYNKKFWKTVKPFLSDKVKTFPKITLVEKEKIISDESKIANSFRNLFENAICSFGIKANEHSQKNNDLRNPVENAIKKFGHHPRINLINKNISNMEDFDFSPADHENILKEVINLDNKNRTFKKIPTRGLKDASDVCSPVLPNIWNEEILLNKNFPENRKLADLTLFLKRTIKVLLEITDQ